MINVNIVFVTYLHVMLYCELGELIIIMKKTKKNQKKIARLMRVV